MEYLVKLKHEKEFRIYAESQVKALKEAVGEFKIPDYEQYTSTIEEA